MMTRKTQYGWMAVGAMLCLLAIGIALRMRDTNRSAAHADGQLAQNINSTAEPPPAIPEEPKKPEPKTIEPPPAPPDVILPPSTPMLPADPPPVPAAPPPAPGPVPPPPPLPPPTLGEGPGVGPAPTETQNPAPLPPPAPVGKETAPPPAPMPALGPMPPARDPEPLPVPPTAIVPVSATTKTDVGPGEPPLAAVTGPLQMYEVRTGGETIQDVARRTLGAGERWMEIQKLNPGLKPGAAIAAGTLVRLPAEACVVANDEIEAIKPLPAMRPKSAPAVAKKILPLTGTYPCTIDDQHVLTLPKALRDQLGNTDTLLVSPGPDQCLWITNHAHLERLAERLELSPAKEIDVRVFKRLYYAQTEKASLAADGTVAISDKLVQFAGLRQDVVLVGIDEHFELWDAAKWRSYTQQKSAEARSAMEHD